jgi:sugar phosphate isomerase/epimerase
MKRRKFMERSAKSVAGLSLVGLSACGGKLNKTEQKTMLEKTSEAAAKELFFSISLAQWSLHKKLQAGEMDNLDFAAKTRSFDIDGIEYVNQFFKDKAKDTAYLNEMNNRAKEEGVKNLLIMIDGEGLLATTDDKKRTEAVENHFKWIDAAAHLGCHAIRVNAGGDGTAEEQKAAGVDGLGRVSTYGTKNNISVIVENHGGLSSNGEWLSSLIQQVDMPNCGTLPDFGNFCIKGGENDAQGNRTCDDEYDKYKGVELLMPFAKAVSAKSNVFDEYGNERVIDYPRMLKLVKDAGYKGYIGVEFEGGEVSEEEGIILTRDLLRKAGAALS